MALGPVGESKRANIHRGTFRIFALYSVTKSVYVSPEVQVVINYNNRNDTDFFLRGELGLVLGGTTFYVKPGAGIAPDPNNRSWGIEAGVRVPF